MGRLTIGEVVIVDSANLNIGYLPTPLRAYWDKPFKFLIPLRAWGKGSICGRSQDWFPKVLFPGRIFGLTRFGF